MRLSRDSTRDGRCRRRSCWRTHGPERRGLVSPRRRMKSAAEHRVIAAIAAALRSGCCSASPRVSASAVRPPDPRPSPARPRIVRARTADRLVSRYVSGPARASAARILAERTLISPADVRYEVDLSKLQPATPLGWRLEHLSVRIPDIEIPGPMATRARANWRRRVLARDSSETQRDQPPLQRRRRPANRGRRGAERLAREAREQRYQRSSRCAQRCRVRTPSRPRFRRGEGARVFFSRRLPLN